MNMKPNGKSRANHNPNGKSQIDPLPTYLGHLDWIGLELVLCTIFVFGGFIQYVRDMTNGCIPPLCDLSLLFFAAFCCMTSFSKTKLLEPINWKENAIVLSGGFVLLVTFIYTAIIRQQQWQTLLLSMLFIICWQMALYYLLRTAYSSKSDDSLGRLYIVKAGVLAIICGISFAYLVFVGGMEAMKLFVLVINTFAALFGVIILLQLINIKTASTGGETFLKWIQQVFDWHHISATHLRGASIDRRRGVFLMVFSICTPLFFLIVFSYLNIQAVALKTLSLAVFIAVCYCASSGALRAWAYLQSRAETLLNIDRRPPILFLRSFADDERFVWRLPWSEIGQAAIQLTDFSIETRIAPHFSRFGPFIAIGSPLEEIPLIGAARAKLSDSKWRDAVINWMNAANTIVMLVGKTEWVTWELAKLIDEQYLHKVILIFPPEVNVVDRLEYVQQTFSATRWFSAFTEIASPATVRAIIFESDWTLTIIRSDYADRNAQHFAILVAHALTLRRAYGGSTTTLNRVVPYRRLFLIVFLIMLLLARIPTVIPERFASLGSKSDMLCELFGESAIFPPKITSNFMELMIFRVFPHSNAERIGLKPRDRVLSYDGKKPISKAQFIDTVAVVSDNLPRVLFIRRGSHEIKFDVPPGRLGIEVGMVLRREP